MKKETITKWGGGALGAVFVAALATAMPFAAGYLQQRFAPEATDQHRAAMLEPECKRGETLHDQATCFVLAGIDLAKK